MFKIGLSTCGKEINSELFECYREAGIGQMEISVDKTLYPTLDHKAIGKLAKEYEINLWSYHLPFVPFDKVNLSVRSIRDETLKYFNELIGKASDIGIDKFIVHSSGEVESHARPERLECAMESLAMLAEIGAKHGGTIAVEVLPRTCLGNCSDEILYLISGDDRLRVCLDTNHLLNESIVDFIHKVNDKIITTHVSDYDFIDEKHWLPGEGMLDWEAVTKALNDIGYKGAWLYELGFNIPETMTSSRELNCKDIAQNAYEIFNGKEITRIL